MVDMTQDAVGSERKIIANRYKRGVPTHRELKDLLNRSQFEQVEEYSKNIALALYTQEEIRELVALFKDANVLELNSGFGYLLNELRIAGCKVTGLGDANQIITHRFTEVLNINPIDYLKQNNYFKYVISVFPDTSNMLADAVKLMGSGSTLIYNGEGPGKSTANHEFFDYTNKNFYLNISLTERLNRHVLNFNQVTARWKIMTKI